MMTNAWASGHSSVIVTWMTGDVPAGSIEASRAAAPPVSAIVGLPERRFTTPMSRQKTPLLQARAERLGARFLGGEALGVGGGAQLPSLRLPPLDLGEHAPDEALAVALERLLDAPDVDQVAADSDDHLAAASAVRRAPRPSAPRIRRTLASRPMKIASPIEEMADVELRDLRDGGDRRHRVA